MKKNRSASGIRRSSSVFGSRGIYCPASINETKKFLALLFNHPRKWYCVTIGIPDKGYKDTTYTRKLEPWDSFLDLSGCLLKVVSQELIELIDTKTGECFGQHFYKPPQSIKKAL
jgi:hypothetical protein